MLLHKLTVGCEIVLLVPVLFKRRICPCA